MTWYQSFILPRSLVLSLGQKLKGALSVFTASGTENLPLPVHWKKRLGSLLAIYHLIDSEPTINFGRQRFLLRSQCVISKSNVKLCFARWFVCRYNIARMFACWNSIARACFIFLLSTPMTSVSLAIFPRRLPVASITQQYPMKR